MTDRWAATLDKFPNFRAYGERFMAENEKHFNSENRGKDW